MLARQPDELGGLPKDSRWHTCARSGKAPWTDDHTNVFGALNLT